jgi:hypothetical protein
VAFLNCFITTAAAFGKYDAEGTVDQGKLLKNYKKFPTNIIFPKGFLFNRGKNVGLHLKSRGPLKNIETRSGPSSGLGLSIYVIKRNKNLAGLSL